MLFSGPSTDVRMFGSSCPALTECSSEPLIPEPLSRQGSKLSVGDAYLIVSTVQEDT
jgi:hypothetical protein